MLTVYRWHVLSENKKLDSGDPAQIAQVIKRGVTEEMVRLSHSLPESAGAETTGRLTLPKRALASGRSRLAVRDVLRPAGRTIGCRRGRSMVEENARGRGRKGGVSANCLYGLRLDRMSCCLHPCSAIGQRLFRRRDGPRRLRHLVALALSPAALAALATFVHAAALKFPPDSPEHPLPPSSSSSISALSAHL
jgi:hypothetical protein